MAKSSPPGARISGNVPSDEAFDDIAGVSGGPTSKNFKISVAKNSLAVSWEVIVEGQRFLPPDFSTEDGIWVRNFEDYPVTGLLDVHLNASGVDNGGDQIGVAAARVSVGRRDLPGDLVARTTRGYGHDYKTYEV